MAARFNRVHLMDIIIISGLAVVFIDKVNFGVLPSLLWLRLFFGLWFIAALPKSFFNRIGKYLHLLAIWTILEYSLFQTIPQIVGAWPNYINSEGALANYQLSGFLAGPYSWGGNRTITGVISLALFIYESSRLRKYLFLLSTILSFSTTAILLLGIYLGIKHWKITVCFSPLLIFILSRVDFGYRLSVDYISKILLEYKVLQWEKSQNILDGHLLLGNGNVSSENIDVSNYGLYFGDFMMLDLFSITGFAGLTLFILMVFQKSNRSNILPLFILLLGSFHYHVLFSLPGQLIFGYLVNVKK